MSPLKKHITVRSGHILGHFDSVELAADFAQRLGQAKTVQRPHVEGNALPEIDFAGEAKAVIDCATMCVHHLGASTVAKGFQKYKLPSHLHRSVRELDAASSLLRHPGAALKVLAALKSWLATNPQPRLDQGCVPVTEACANFNGTQFSFRPDADLFVPASASATSKLSGIGGSLTSSTPSTSNVPSTWDTIGPSASSASATSKLSGIGGSLASSAPSASNGPGTWDSFGPLASSASATSKLSGTGGSLASSAPSTSNGPSSWDTIGPLASSASATSKLSGTGGSLTSSAPPTSYGPNTWDTIGPLASSASATSKLSGTGGSLASSAPSLCNGPGTWDTIGSLASSASATSKLSRLVASSASTAPSTNTGPSTLDTFNGSSSSTASSISKLSGNGTEKGSALGPTAPDLGAGSEIKELGGSVVDGSDAEVTAGIRQRLDSLEAKISDLTKCTAQESRKDAGTDISTGLARELLTHLSNQIEGVSTSLTSMVHAQVRSLSGSLEDFVQTAIGGATANLTEMLATRCDSVSNRMDSFETSWRIGLQASLGAATSVGTAEDEASESSHGYPNEPDFSLMVKNFTPHQIAWISQCDSWDDARTIMKRANTPCPHYAYGSCKFGDRCGFLHAACVDTETPPLAQGSELRIGDEVQVFGLQSAKELNGRCGRIDSLLEGEGTQRLAILLEGESKTKSFKRANVRKKAGS